VNAVIVERSRFGARAEIPALVMSPPEQPAAPVVVYQHGYTGRKENDLGNLFALAERGYRTVSLDARLHGERRPADFAERFERDFPGTFRQVVEETAADLSVVVDELEVTKAGFIGVSMGAYIAYRALVHEPRLAAVVPFIGSPSWPAELPERVSELAGTLQERGRQRGPEGLPALLIMNGQQDELVSPEGATLLHQALRPIYAAAPDRLEYSLDPALGHAVTEPMWRAAVDWIARFLR
jgi:pimeloyl-ACP methyl ester carboxylesterase